jgi:alpha-L-fucosidase
MPVPTWWNEHRFGIFVHANIATVPAFAPIGQYADWYQSHLGDPVEDVLLHPTPLVEVLAHHRDRWAHVERFDDFWPLLTFDRFDADAWAELATEAGAGYLIHVTKHHDGLCWWDAPNTDRTVVAQGPRRDVLAEVAAACRRAGLVFGTYYSLLDWGDDRYPDARYVDEILHPHVLDLVERHGSAVLWGDGHWGHGPQHWRSEALVDAARAVRPDLVVNDRWWLAEPDVVTYEYDTPHGILERPWELCRGIGHSFCHNRAERAEHHLDGRAIVDLLTEVVAKGGNLLLNVGPAVDGSVPDLQAGPLRDAGRWIRRHGSALDGTVPWTAWGDDATRFTVTRRADGDVVNAIDLSGAGDFPLVVPASGTVTSVRSADGAGIEWTQHEHGLTVWRTDRTPVDGPAVYEVSIAPRSAPVHVDERLFDLDGQGERRGIPLDEVLADARAGAIVQLGEGTYLGPARVPDGVTVRGLGADRTTIDGASDTAVTLGTGAHLEHVAVRGGGTRLAWFPVPALRVAGPQAVVLACRIEGHVIVEAPDARVRATTASGVVARGVDRLVVSRCRLHGMRWDVGVDVRGGAGHVVDSCELHGHLCAVRLDGTVGATVRSNDVQGRWWGVHLVGTDATEVAANSITTTMRAVDVEGGTLATVTANVVRDGDSGCVVQRGAAGVVVAGNRWERCRIGLLAWDVPAVRHHDNTAVDLHEPERTVTIGPA